MRPYKDQGFSNADVNFDVKRDYIQYLKDDGRYPTDNKLYY
jgi:hypothetical protein